MSWRVTCLSLCLALDYQDEKGYVLVQNVELVVLLRPRSAKKHLALYNTLCMKLSATRVPSALRSIDETKKNIVSHTCASSMTRKT